MPRLPEVDIADEADMALTAVYRHFPNKQSALRELALQTFAHDTETLLTGEVGLPRVFDARWRRG